MEASVLTISCDDCTHQNSAACEDCVVSFVLDHDPSEALVIDAAEVRAVRLLEGAGLLPRLRHERRAS